MRLVPLVLAGLLPLPLGGAAPAPTALTIELSNYAFEPATIRLHHGQPYVLNLVNRSGRGHNFVAPQFLAAAGAGRGKIEVADGATVSVAIVAPAAGSYKVKCTHFTHAMRGMKGNIIVD